MRWWNPRFAVAYLCAVIVAMVYIVPLGTASFSFLDDHEHLDLVRTAPLHPLYQAHAFYDRPVSDYFLERDQMIGRFRPVYWVLHYAYAQIGADNYIALFIVKTVIFLIFLALFLWLLYALWGSLFAAGLSTVLLVLDKSTITWFLISPSEGEAVLLVLLAAYCLRAEYMTKEAGMWQRLRWNMLAGMLMLLAIGIKETFMLFFPVVFLFHVFMLPRNSWQSFWQALRQRSYRLWPPLLFAVIGTVCIVLTLQQSRIQYGSKAISIVFHNIPISLFALSQFITLALAWGAVRLWGKRGYAQSPLVIMTILFGIVAFFNILAYAKVPLWGNFMHTRYGLPAAVMPYFILAYLLAHLRLSAPKTLVLTSLLLVAHVGTNMVALTSLTFYRSTSVVETQTHAYLRTTQPPLVLFNAGFMGEYINSLIKRNCAQGFCPDYAYLDSNQTQKYFGYFMPQFRSLTISRSQTLPQGHCILSHTLLDSLKAYGYRLHVIPGHYYSMELRRLRLRTHDASAYIYSQH